MNDLQGLIDDASAQIARANTAGELDNLRVQLLGKKGTITAQLKSLGQMSPEARKQAGQAINQAKQTLIGALNERREYLQAIALSAQLDAERIDVTMPGRGIDRGGYHPIHRAMSRIVEIFRRYGYAVAEGPEIEDDYHNFEALNFPPHHPARAMHDTFYLPDGRLLRTHTSPVQIRAMKAADGPPIRLVAPGRVYRSDSDQTHTPMFHQVEGLVIGRHVTMADLKGSLLAFIEAFFEVKTKLLFRPSYFPFTEPSADVFMSWQRPDGGEQWLEVLGCGMVHPNVLAEGGIDPEVFSGFAFGLGVERFAMLRYGVADLRTFFENDLRFLRQFQ